VNGDNNDNKNYWVGEIKQNKGGAHDMRERGKKCARNFSWKNFIK